MSVDGKNFVELQGTIKWPEFKETRNGYQLFKGKIAVPFKWTDKASGEEKEGSSYYSFVVWGELAVEMSSLKEGVPVLIQGALQSRSYEANCKSCAAPEKKYWTDVLIDNFMEVS